MGEILSEEGVPSVGTVEGLMVACQLMIAPEDITCDCDMDAEELQPYVAWASDAIAILTGGKITGECECTVRPCSDRACGRGRGCSCCDLDAITLPGPNPTVTEVKIDGVALAASDYKIVDGVKLVRTGRKRWPGCQDITDADTEDNTFSITYRVGFIPLVAKEAASEIVCDMIQGLPGEKPKRSLPPSARSVNVAGVQIQLEQQIVELRQRIMMLPSLIRLLSIYAPDGPEPATVYSPELEDGWTLHHVS